MYNYFNMREGMLNEFNGIGNVAEPGNGTKGANSEKPDEITAKDKAAEYRTRNAERHYDIAMEALEQKVYELGILERTLEGINVFHEDEYLKFFSAERKSDNVPVADFIKQHFSVSQSVWSLVADFLLSQKAVSVSEYREYQKRKENDQQSAQIIPRPLLSIPVLDGRATEQQLKNNDSLVDYLSLPLSSNALSELMKKRFGVSSVEYQLLFTIYNKRHGDAYRDRSGSLLMKDVDGNYVPVGEEVISRVSSYRIQGVRNGLAKGLYPVALQNDLLTRDDIKLKQIRDGGENERLERNIRTKGMVFVEGASYILGVEFEGCSLVKMQDGIYAVLSNADAGKRITHIFRPLPKEDIDRRKQAYFEKNGKEVSKAGLYVSIKDIDVREFRVTDFVEPHLRSEDMRGYAGRISRYTSDYGVIREVTREMYDRSGILMHKLSFGEQLRCAYLASLGKREADNLYALASKFGITGLKTVLSIDFDNGNLDIVTSLVNNLEHDGAQMIFKKYAEVVDTTERVSDYLLVHFNGLKGDERELLNIKENLLTQAKNILASFASDAEHARKSKKKLTGEEIASRLEEINAEMLIFLASFKTIVESGQAIKLEDIKDMEFVSCYGGELSMEEHGTMADMYMRNYVEFPKLQSYLLDNFRTKLADPNTVFKVFRHQGKIVGFYREDIKADGSVYFGSFNIDPDYQGYRIGETILKNRIDSTAKDHVIEADVVETFPIAGNYIERGFLAVSHSMYEDAPGIKIFRNDSMNQTFKTKDRNFKIDSDIKVKQNEFCLSSDGSYAVFTIDARDLSKVPFNMLNKNAGPGSSWAITRYIKTVSGEKKSIQVIFEKVSTDLLDQYCHPDSVKAKAA